MSAFRVQQEIVVLSDISGTGIRKGDVGKVIYVQQGRRDTDRSTDLAPTAFQVRFKGGAEIWMTADEIARAAETRPARAPTRAAEDA
jgi:hypothetical protein